MLKRVSIGWMFLVMLVGCSADVESNDLLQVVSTTTMIEDLVSVIGGDCVESIGLMSEGVDPHLYKASAKDVKVIENSDVIVYNGLHLEGQMIDVFNQLDDTSIICLEDGIDTMYLLESEDAGDSYDPHIWFDVYLWKDAACYVGEQLSLIDPSNAAVYALNLENYLAQLEQLNQYIIQRIHEIDEQQRVLITAHDAFNYFGNAYGFEVLGLQGISTDSEASTSDVSSLATYIVEHEIKAIFVESSISSKNIEALQAAVKAKGFDVVIGGELYSDSLGQGSYIDTVKSNIDTIVGALK